jgi:hypothetical protein
MKFKSFICQKSIPLILLVALVLTVFTGCTGNLNTNSDHVSATTEADEVSELANQGESEITIDLNKVFENIDNIVYRVDDDMAKELEGKSEDEIVAVLNEKAREKTHYSMHKNPIFESGTSEGTLMITNSASNQYPQLIEIYTTDDNTLIYTREVAVGETIEKDKLLVNLPAGEHNCVAYISNIDTGGKFGGGIFNIKLTVLN